MDIKGPLAIQTYAAAAMTGSAPGDIIVAHTVLEERGGLGMKLLLESGSVRPAAVINGEATHGDVCIGHRGRAELEVILTGTAGHASAPERAQNPLDLLGDVLGAVRELGRSQPTDPTLGAASVASTMVDVRPESRNVIPDTVVVALDWRTLPDTREEDLLGALDAALRHRIRTVPDGFGVETRIASVRQRTWTGVEVERSLLTPGFLMPPDDPVVRAAAGAVGRRDDPSSPAQVRPWTFATDGGWSRGAFGIPTVGFAPGEERYAHTNRERLDVEEARWCFERYPALVAAVQRSAGERPARKR
jgi:acetylornithine deacetylase/succinyl-diaminopimelate desuccinylase-like protein